ncbi:MAG: hypothetical protein Q8J96_09070, partial [Rhodocyclaceae bacterium]|nr:hypothetical protein [Rhodocyclaceae bacterium]
GAAPGYALRVTNSANRINYLPDHQFAQLDAHNFSPPGRPKARRYAAKPQSAPKYERGLPVTDERSDNKRHSRAVAA